MRVKGNILADNAPGINTTDGVLTFTKDVNLNFNPTGFYLSKSSTNSPVVNLKNTGVDVTSGGSQFSDVPELNFNPANFYISTNARSAPVINLVANTEPPRKVSLLTSNVVATTTVVTPVPELQFLALAGKIYHFSLRMIVSTSNTSEGFIAGWNWPADYNIFTASLAANISSGTAGMFNGVVAIPAFTTVTVTSMANGPGVQVYHTFEGMVQVNTTGQVIFKFATEIGGGNTATLFAGSFLEYREILANS